MGCQEKKKGGVAKGYVGQSGREKRCIIKTVADYYKRREPKGSKKAEAESRLRGMMLKSDGR